MHACVNVRVIASCAAQARALKGRACTGLCVCNSEVMQACLCTHADCGVLVSVALLQHKPRQHWARCARVPKGSGTGPWL
jgi:hypothetical protein